MNKPTFSGRTASQKECEIAAFIALLNERKVESYLEIGARHGDTFHRVCLEVESLKIAYAVDLPGGPWGQDGTEEALIAACADLEVRWGLQGVRMFLGDSQSADIRMRVLNSLAHDDAPFHFDAVLIDGDHRYEGVKRDYELWGPLARKLIAFHDIDGVGVIQKKQRLPVEVPVLWNEVKHDFPHFEFIDSDRSRPMGIGVLDVEAVRAV